MTSHIYREEIAENLLKKMPLYYDLLNSFLESMPPQKNNSL